MSRPYAEVIGDPIAHSKSPAIHGFWLEELGLVAEYRRCHVLANDLGDYIRNKQSDADWLGCNVTIPHKQAVLPFLDRLDEKAQRVGAVNTIFRGEAGELVGTNTDVDGVAEAIAPIGAEMGTAVVIGSGGAAKAAFAYLAESDFAHVRVLARNTDKARSACRECGLDAEILLFTEGTTAFEGASLLINATQLGMEGQDTMPPFVLEDVSAMSSDALVFDMVYAPLETLLLDAARRAGLKTTDGLVMLVGQAATAFERFFGCAPRRENDAALRRILTS